MGGILRRGEVEENLIRRMEEIYGQTEVVRTKRYTEGFRTRKGVRQDCVMSPLLFKLYMTGIKEILRKRSLGRMGMGGMKI